ncbi:tetratricopeptide repeat protein [Stigmatella sp. ncwal1]|uniref:Tetratricopeptide repeat protein n=1 Tax=Stigmatella ashevillensis TaxID=2995309 RepID=A0ABT5DLJ1_9BACT|nr:tetratricopeptide repeat protein [Stigmatella ashevillena]MDC0713998.1 tetratricopeptide repeat protein [Stigmatella ashevillena]
MDARVPEGDSAVHGKVERHLQVVARLLREHHAPKAFGELVRACRILPMTPQLAAALVTVSLQAGTEAAAITLLSASLEQVEGRVQRAVRGQLARVLRRVEQLPRAIEALEVLLSVFPDDHRSRRVLQELLQRTGRWEALVASLESEAHEAFVRGEFYRAARATRWRARVQAEQLRNLARAAESYGKAANYLEQMEDAVGALSVRLDGLRVLHAAGASEAVLTAASSVCLSAGSRLNRGAEVRQVLEELRLIPARVELPPEKVLPVDPSAEGASLTEVVELPEVPPAQPVPAAVSPSTPTVLEMPAVVEPEPRAEPEPPVGNREDPAFQQRLETQLIARQAWPELAQFYLARAEQAKEPSVRAEALTRLAEVMETELEDPAGAARMYQEIVTLTGDRVALKEQVRLLAKRGDPALVQRALNEAVQGARSSRARANAYLTRAERELETGDWLKAKSDFETAEALTPGLLLVLAGLVRCVPDQDRPSIAARLRASLTVAPRRSPDRLEALRVLATVAEGSLGDPRLAQWAWSEVLAEEPGDTHAREQLTGLARLLGDKNSLGQLLREQLAREPRGPAARLARLELVSVLENAGDTQEALTELRQAVRFEPGHKEAWLLLADRLTACGQIGEAAWALEHAATAMEDEEERQRTWARLARFCQEVLKDSARAEVYARRAENLRRSREEPDAPLVPEAPRSARIRREREMSVPRTVIFIPPPGVVELTPSGQALPLKPPSESHEPAPVPPDTSSSPTIEFAAVAPPGTKMPFSEEEPTATEAPEGFVPPAEPVPAESAPLEATPLDAESVLDAESALNELLGDSSPNTSTSLTAWSWRKPRPPPAEQKRTQSRKAPSFPEEKTSLREPTSAGKPAPSRPPETATVRTVVPPPQVAVPPPQEKAAAPAERSALAPIPSSKGGTSKRPALEVSEVRSATGTQGAPGARRPVPDDSPFAKVSPREPEGGAAPVEPSGPVQNTAFISWEAPPGKMEPVRRIARSRGGTSSGPAKGGPSPAAGAEPAVFQQVRERPLDEKLYLQVAEYFEARGDGERAALMREIADAIEGREGPAPRALRQPLSAEERSGLRHPLLRTPPGELLSCVGLALCRLFPAYGRAAGTQDPLRPERGPGAPLAIEALRATERLLGIEAPEVALSEDNGPPFSLIYTSAPRLLVGKQAVRQVLSASELRFYAGRALMCLGPELLALRSLKKDQVLRGLALLATVLKDSQVSGPEARAVREALKPPQLARAAALFDSATRQFDVSALADAARDSANRAGLVACGSVGPALASLRMKRALEREVVELVRFAASERYFQLRASR